MTTKRPPSELGTESIGKLLRQYAIPSIIAMTASSIYNMVDSIFIGQGVGAMALSGLAITFPMMNILAAFGSMVGMGASMLISVKLGQKDHKTAELILGNSCVLNLAISVFFTILGLLFLDPILYFFGATDVTISYAREYMQIVLISSVVMYFYFGFNTILRAMGHPKLSMIATIATVVINAILDPILIFGAGWGIRGAAIATTIAQMIALIWQLRVLSNKKEFIHLKRGIYRLKEKIVKETFMIGLPPCLMNLASCFVVIFLNWGLLQYGGDYAVGAYGIVHKITYVFIMVVIGLNQGMQPIAGYNYGAGIYSRLIKVLKTTIGWATLVMTVAFLVGELLPEYVVRIFTTDAEMVRIATSGMRITAIFFPLIGFQMVTGNFFQSIAKSGTAIFLSLSRQLLFLIPFIVIFPHFWGINGVWMSLPASDLVSAIVAGIILHAQMKKFKAKIQNQ